MTSQLPPDSHDAPSSGSARALAELTKELRSARPPELDFDRMEQELFATLDAAPLTATPLRRARSFVPAVVGALALAAGALFFLRAPAPPPASLPAPPIAAAPSTLAEHVDTAETPRHFEQVGLASWTLAAHSRASVTQTPNLVSVTLEEGAIDVDVVPQPVAERFLVIVDHTRVAVHGTRFRVARTPAGVDVDVAHGTVAVGSIETAGQSPRWLLPAPIGGTFSLTGTDGSLRPLRPFSEEAAAPPTPPPTRTKPSPARSSSARLPDTAPSAAAVEPQVQVMMLSPVALGARAQDAATSCFYRNAKLSAGVHLQVVTTLSLSADAQGVLAASFDPPLAPAVESCFRDSMNGVRAPAGTYDIPLHLTDP